MDFYLLYEILKALFMLFGIVRISLSRKEKRHCLLPWTVKSNALKPLRKKLRK